MNLFESAVLVKQKKPLKIFKLKKPIPGKNQGAHWRSGIDQENDFRGNIAEKMTLYN